MNTRKPLTHAFYLLCLLGACHPAAATESTDANANDTAVKKLLAQASYWHSKAHDEMAIDALQKVLAADDKNIDAMYSSRKSGGKKSPNFHRKIRASTR